MPKYPNITINLSGFKNDNFMIIIKCLRALRENSLGHELENFVKDIEKGGAENLLRTASNWFNVQ
ncbi:MAG TPA: hypothetical protein PKJ33_03005 [Alphaproteobacteria bacterium]|nr:hypothetical protein [Alphaproteobacteria bacterium]